MWYNRLPGRIQHCNGDVLAETLVLQSLHDHSLKNGGQVKECNSLDVLAIVQGVDVLLSAYFCFHFPFCYLVM